MNKLGESIRMPIADAAAFGRVAVMLGGHSSEREVSLDTGTAVLEALTSRGVDAHGWDPAARSMHDFVRANFDRVWIALHGPGGEDGTLQGMLKWLDTPFTGSGVMASALAMDKVRSKHLFGAAGLPTPEFRVVHGHADAVLALEQLGLPLIVKPSGQGSSVGMTKVFEAAELREAVDLALRYDETALIETCMSGDEMTVAVLQGEALPTIRIQTPRIFYDYRAKYESERTEYHCPGAASADDEARFRELALAAFETLGCRGWGRVDFMTTDNGEPQILEVNTVPGMTSHSLVPMAAKQVGVDFEELCWRILETSASEPARIDDRREVVNGA